MGTAVKTIGQDEWHILKAPFQKKALIWDAVVVGATGVLIANDESVAQQVPVSWHQTGINISNACTYGTAAAAGGIYLTGLFTHDEHAQRTGVLRRRGGDRQLSFVRLDEVDLRPAAPLHESPARQILRRQLQQRIVPFRARGNVMDARLRGGSRVSQAAGAES